MRLEWRMNKLPPRRTGELTTVRSHSHCLVAADGTEIATIATDAVNDVRALLRRTKRRAASGH